MTLTLIFLTVVFIFSEPCLTLNKDVLSSLQTFYATHFQNHCPRGFSLFQFSTNIKVIPDFDSNWTVATFSHSSMNFESIALTTACPLMVISNQNANQTEILLNKSKPFRNALIIVDLPNQEDLTVWLEIAQRSKVPFLVATPSLGGSKIVPFHMICPFQDPPEYSRPIAYWMKHHGFDVNVVGLFETRCNGCYGTWKVGYIPVPPTVLSGETEEDPPIGFEVDVIELVAKHMGVTLEYVLARFDVIFYDGQVLGQRTIDVHSYEYDLSIGNPLAIVPNQEFVDFGEMLYFFKVIYGSRIPIALPNYLSIVQVFSSDLWIAIITSNVLVSFLVHRLFKLYQGKTLKDNVKTKSRTTLNEILVRISIGLTEPEHVRWFPNLCAGSVAMGVFYFYSMFLCLSYTSTLLSILIKAEKEHPVDTSADAWKRGSTIYLLDYIDFLCTDCPSFHKYPEDIQKVAHQTIKTNGMANMTVMTNVVKYLKKEIFEEGAIFSSAGISTSTTELTSLTNDIYESKESLLMSVPGSTFVPKYAPWGPKISQVQGRLIQSGIVDHIAKRYTQPKIILEDELLPLTLEHMFSPLILLTSGLSASVPLFIGELCMWKWKMNFRSNNSLE